MRQFYYKLYSTECNTLDDLRKSFLDQISLPLLQKNSGSSWIGRLPGKRSWMLFAHFKVGKHQGWMAMGRNIIKKWAELW